MTQYIANDGYGSYAKLFILNFEHKGTVILNYQPFRPTIYNVPPTKYSVITKFVAFVAA